MILKPRCNAKATRDPDGFRSALGRWFLNHGRDLPWRRIRDPYGVLVSEIMLQQTQVATVLAGGYYTRFLEKFPPVEVLAAAGDDELLKAWEGLGYYRRARLLRDAARVVIERHGGLFPSDTDALLSLPGVGHYTAGALRAFAFDLPAVLVDGNIARVIARLSDCRNPIDTAAGRKAVWRVAGKLACPEHSRTHHSTLMELGQLVCRPGVPDCPSCPVAGWCATRTPEKLPVKRGRVALTAVEERVIFATDACGRVLLHREDGSRRNGLWKLPPLSDGGMLAPWPVIESEQYTITRYKVSLAVYDARRSRRRIKTAANEKWFAPGEIASIAMPSPYRRVITRLLESADKSM